jgi:hypothetical protein
MTGGFTLQTMATDLKVVYGREGFEAVGVLQA